MTLTSPSSSEISPSAIHVYRSMKMKTKKPKRIRALRRFIDEDGDVWAAAESYGAFGIAKPCSATPGNDYCNGNIAVVQSAQEFACMCDCIHIDDVAGFLAEKGLDKRPAGK